MSQVLASGANVNVLVLDNEMYSNTGGQVCARTHARTRANIKTHTPMHTRTQTRAHTHTRTHRRQTHTHTRTHNRCTRTRRAGVQSDIEGQLRKVRDEREKDAEEGAVLGVAPLVALCELHGRGGRQRAAGG